MAQNIRFTLLLLLLNFLVIAQDCNWSQAVVATESGLILRAKPGSGYVGVMADGDSLEYCADTSYGSITVEGVKGYWRLVKHQGRTGYAFDGFLLKIDSEIDSLREASQKMMAQADSSLGIKKPKKPNLHPNYRGDQFQFLIETYNYCGDVSGIDLSLYWYGVFMDSEVQPTGKMTIRPLDLKVSLSKEKIAKGMEFDILTDLEERSLFLIGSNKVIDHQSVDLLDVMKGIQVRGKRLFPGQELILNRGDQLRLSATGQILKTGPCPEAKDYSLNIKASRNGNEISQDLKSLIPHYGKCAIPELYWYGDLSGDGYPEIIFVSVEEQANVFHLLKSNPGTTELFSVQAVFRVENCLSNEH